MGADFRPGSWICGRRRPLATAISGGTAPSAAAGGDGAVLEVFGGGAEPPGSPGSDPEAEFVFVARLLGLARISDRGTKARSGLAMVDER